jgi:glycerophosphoryl diester phosphodiesterase
MNVIAHRGCWREPEEKNTLKSFSIALEKGFGIETDVRDYAGRLVISHDVATDQSILFKDFVDLMKIFNAKNIALNIKSDGLHDLLIDSLAGIEGYFVFDMSVPDTVGYKDKGINYYTRYSDYEPSPALLSKAKGVWFDNFSDGNLDCLKLIELLKNEKNIVLVSPELHRFDYKNYWTSLNALFLQHPEYMNLVSICTDYPELAMEFFKNGEK